MRIGILGGGQLSKMLALAGIPLGLQFSFYFPRTEHSLNTLGEILHGSYEDLDQLKTFAQHVDVITYENENIPWQTLAFLETLKPVFPDRHAITVAQDRLLEKNFFLDLGIPTNRFIPINTRSDIEVAAKELGYPFIIKKRTAGYDGKGQLKITEAAELDNIPTEFYSNSIAEEYIKFDREVSLIMASTQKTAVFYDICENTHHQGILIKTRNKLQDEIFALAKQHLEIIRRKLNYVGILAVEFFQKENILLANEMAPRVHNSGHWTIEGSVTSQFENHLRAIADLPLGDTSSTAEIIMFNILSHMPDKKKLLAFEGLHLHDYGKSPAKGRKLGHVTLEKQVVDRITELEAILF